MFIQSILSKLWITRLGSLAIKSAISTKSNGAITPNEKLPGKRRRLFSQNVRNCSKLTTVHDFSALFLNWHFHPKSQDEISFRGKDCNTLPGYSGRRPGYSGHGVPSSCNFCPLGPTIIKTGISPFLSLPHSSLSLSPSRALSPSPS